MSAEEFRRRLLGRSKPAPSTALTLLPAAARQTESNAGDETETLIAELRDATRSAGMQLDDPLMPLVTTIENAIRFFDIRTARSDQAAEQSSRRVAGALQQARDVADAQAAHFRAELASTEADFIRRVGTSIARSADDALARRVRVLDRNSILIAAAFLIATAGGCLGGGYWWGSSNARADIHETEINLQAAFSSGSDDAKIWFGLMTWNNSIHTALHACSGSDHSFTDQGRKACNVPLWIEPPQLFNPSQQ